MWSWSLVGHEPSYDQTRIENVPGDIMGYDARTGEPLWKFHVIPRPGELGHETWENDAWQWSGDMSSWAPAAADPELGLVYIVTNASTVQTYTGHRPGHNLFGGCVLALDVKTGERRWHFQIHHSDQWNYDIPTAPLLMDLTVDGTRVPALIQHTKQGLIFAFNRETGEPIWPIEERPVMQTQVPGNYTAPTQPYPTRPEPLDPIVLRGITDEFMIDYTPDLKQEARQILSQFRVDGLYVPPLPHPHDNSFRNVVGCMGGLNIYHPPVADPTTGIMYAPHQAGVQRATFHGPYRRCRRGARPARAIGRGVEGTRAAHPDHRHDGCRVGTRRSGRASSVDRGPAGLQAGVPGVGRLRHEHRRQAVDIPIGETPERLRNHPRLRGVELGETGGTGNSIQMVMGDLLVQTTEDLRGETELER